MSKRGLSMEEKKVRLLELFHEEGEFFTFKELEKIAPKQKGITQQTVKDVLTEVTGDSLVQFDKIGTGNYYWSFPSAAGAVKQDALDKAKAELESIDSKLSESALALKEAKKGREDTDERTKLLQTLAEVNETALGLKSELAAFGAADPVKYERKKEAVTVAKEAAQRWTDNTLILMQYLKGGGQIQDEELRTMLGIDETWDDLPL